MTHFLQILIAGLFQGCIYALLALGFSLIFRVTSAVNLAQGAFCIVGALVTGSCETTLGLPILASCLIGVAATSVLAALLGAAVFVPGLGRLPNGPMFILTVGLLISLEGASLILWGSQAYSLQAFSGERPLEWAGLLILPQGLWLLGTSVIITASLAYLLNFTRAGRAFRACAENPLAASLMGIGVRRIQLLSFVLAAILGAAGGIVMGPMTSFQFDTAGMYTIYGFIAAVIGGIGSPMGAAMGGLLLGLASQLAASYVSSLFSNSFALLLLLVILLWRPGGLFSSGPSRREDVREEGRSQRAIVRLGLTRGLIVTGIAAIAVFVLIPLFFRNSGLMSSIIIAAIIYLAVLGLDVLMGFAGQVSLGQGGFMAIGGYVASILAVTYQVSPLLATLCALVASLVCALILALGTMRLRGIHLAIATLAFSLLIDSLTVGLDDISGGPSGLTGIPSFSLGKFVFDTPLRNYFLIVGILALVLAGLTTCLRSGFGRALLAVRADALAACALGVRVRSYRVVAFCISAALGSIAGSLYAFYFHFLSPEMVGAPLSLQMLSMVMIGGEGTLVGPLFGVVLLTLLPTFFQPLALYKTLVSGLLLTLFSLYLPSGLYGSAVGWLTRERTQKAGVGSVLRRAP